MNDGEHRGMTYTQACLARATVAREQERDLLSVDLHLLHEVSSPQAFSMLRDRQLPVYRPAASLGVADHVVSTVPGRTGSSDPRAQRMLDVFAGNLAEAGVRFVDVDSSSHGIVHVVASEQGMVGPGDIVVCGDSHTTTLGALGAVAWGIGTSEVAHVLATQAIWSPRYDVVAIEVTGKPGPHATAKDVVLRACGALGPKWGIGRRAEWQGPYVSDSPMSARFTICNMSAELGLRSAMVRPDDTTWEFLRERLDEPSLQLYRDWDRAAREKTVAPAGVFEVHIDGLSPQVTWGTNLGQVASVNGNVPLLPADGDESAFTAALRYVGLRPGQPLRSVAIQHAFIGSCTNSRIDDLRCAARVVKGRRVAGSVRAVVVPGSRATAEQAEAEGIRATFEAAGFTWREPGCSSCVAINGDTIPPGERCVSSSNRNFEGRQGRGAITHIASPPTVAASAIVGRLAHEGDLS